MNLRSRLLIAVVVAVCVGMIVAGVVTIWQARQSVAVEVDAALSVARQGVSSALPSFEDSLNRDGDIKQLVESFDGDRHVRAYWENADGTVRAESSLAPLVERVPVGFANAIGTEPQRVRIAVPSPAGGETAIVLETDPRNEVIEIWRSFKDTAFVVTVMGAAISTVMWIAFGRALRPLGALSAALRSVSAGSFDARVPADGPPEFRDIATAFNRMMENLRAARARNLDLHRRLLTAQEAERSEIARDLHDEIGSLLFAINVETNAIDRDPAGQSAARAARSIQATVQELRGQIRAIVNRLRPLGLAELGLGGAVDSLVEFWLRVHPGVAINLENAMDDAVIEQRVALTAYRVVQEAVSNALRHGNPKRVAISLAVTHGDNEELHLIVTDDGTGSGDMTPGLGLIGMQERIAAAGGRFATSSTPGEGFSVSVALPLAPRATVAEPLS